VPFQTTSVLLRLAIYNCQNYPERAWVNHIAYLRIIWPRNQTSTKRYFCNRGLDYSTDCLTFGLWKNPIPKRNEARWYWSTREIYSSRSCRCSYPCLLAFIRVYYYKLSIGKNDHLRIARSTTTKDTKVSLRG